MLAKLACITNINEKLMSNNVYVAPPRTLAAGWEECGGMSSSVGWVTLRSN
jgi:hypothetical protein